MILWVSVSTQPETPLSLIINREHLCFQTQLCFSQFWQGLGDCLEADPHRKKNCIGVYLLCSVVLISDVHQSESTIHTCIYPSLVPQSSG